MHVSKLLKISMCFPFLLPFFQASAKYPDDLPEESLPKRGNFALPGSQQLGPFNGFGQNLIGKGISQFYLFSEWAKGPRESTVELFPFLLFGVTDNFAAHIEVPIDVRNKSGSKHSSGVGDVYVEFEYGFYESETNKYFEQASLVGGVSFPTGSAQKDPATGAGAASFFGGATYNRMYEDWYGYTSHGYDVTTTREGHKPGNTFYYQAGIGRHICSCPEKWIFAGLVEINGFYEGKEKLHGRKDPDSGGNTILVIPSLWFSTQRVILQVGIGFPITQHLHGDQRKNHYVIAGNFGWTF